MPQLSEHKHCGRATCDGSHPWYLNRTRYWCEGPEELLPHSRACHWLKHPHGPLCAHNCPTCHGQEMPKEEGTQPWRVTTNEEIDQAIEALQKAGHEIPPRSTIGRILDWAWNKQ